MATTESLNPLIKVTEWDTHIKNVVLFLMVKIKGEWRILTFTERYKKVGFPAGRMEKDDENVFAGMKREYEEESGESLPELKNIQKFRLRSTAIFVAETEDYVPTGPPGHKSDGEVINRHLTRPEHLRIAAEGKSEYFTMRYCARYTAIVLLDLLGL